MTLLKLLSKYIDKTNLNQYNNPYILPSFFFLFFFFFLDYGCLTRSRTTVTYINRLVKLQKRAARIILNAYFMTPSENMFRELNCLSFPNRVKYHLCIMMYKALNNLAPMYLTDLFTTTSKIHDRRLRSVENETLKVPFARTSYYENSFTVNGAKQRNSLPTELRQTTSLSFFKTRIKSFLLSH